MLMTKVEAVANIPMVETAQVICERNRAMYEKHELDFICFDRTDVIAGGIGSEEVGEDDERPASDG